MSNTTPINSIDTNQPKNGWLWVQDYPSELIKLYFLYTAITDWFFWHCAMNKHESENNKNYKCDHRRSVELIDLANDAALCGQISPDIFYWWWKFPRCDSGPPSGRSYAD